jgi:hypothetical protein
MGLLYLYFCIDLSVTHTSCISFTPLDCDSVDVIPVCLGLLISECLFDHNCDSDCDFEWLWLCPSLWLNVCGGVNKCNSDWLKVIVTVTYCDLTERAWLIVPVTVTDWLWLCLTRAVMVCYICGSEWQFLRVTDWLTDCLTDWLTNWLTACDFVGVTVTDCDGESDLLWLLQFPIKSIYL